MISNKTKNSILATNIKICDTPVKKAIGLMFSKKKEDFGLIFIFAREQIVSLHMIFVFYPIDVLFLDKNNKIVDTKENFKPFSLLYIPKKPCLTVIELNNGVINSSKTSLGDIIEFQV